MCAMAEVKATYHELQDSLKSLVIGLCIIKLQEGYTLQTLHVNDKAKAQKEMTVSPGQFITLHTFNVLKEALSWYVVSS